jgi:hypothetical protein
MKKSRKNNNSITFKKISTATQKTLPIVNKGLETIGTKTKEVLVKSKPYLEKGISHVYGVLASGADLGIKSAKNVTRGISKSRRFKNESRKFTRHSNRR